MAFPWPNIEYWLGSFEIFQWIWTSIAKKPNSFMIFLGGEGGGDTVPRPPLDPRVVETILDKNESLSMRTLIHKTPT